AGAFAGLDTLAQLGELGAPPDRAQVVVRLAQVAHRLGADAAGPDVAVGRDVAARPAGLAGDDLALLLEHPFGELVVVGTERLGQPRRLRVAGLARPRGEEVRHRRVSRRRRRDVPADRVQLDPLLGHLGNVRVRLPLLETFV